MRKLFLIIFSIAAVARLSSAEELSWQEAVAQAKQYNPSLKKAVESVNQAKQSYERTYTNFLPQLSLSGSAGQSDSDTNGFSKSNSVGLNGSISLFSGFGDVANTRQRADELHIAEANYARTVSDTFYTLRSNFINLLWAQETVRLSEEILKRRTENYEMIQLKYESGSEDKGSLLRMQADRIQAEYDLARAKRSLITARTAFLRAIGRNDTPPVSVKGDFSTGAPPAMEAPQNYVAQIPEYLAAKYALDKSINGITAAKSEWYPTLTFSAGTSRFGPSWAPENNSWNAGLNLSYPFFPGGRNIYDVRIALLGKTISEASLNETGQQLETRVVTTINNFIDAADNVGVRAKYLDASQQQSSITTTKYMNGLVSYQDWYTIENDYIGSTKLLLNSRRDAALAEAQWNNLLGKGQ
jgi:outer membrane protein TolC